MQQKKRCGCHLRHVILQPDLYCTHRDQDFTTRDANETFTTSIKSAYTAPEEGKADKNDKPVLVGKRHSDSSSKPMKHSQQASKVHIRRQKKERLTKMTSLSWLKIFTLIQAQKQNKPSTNRTMKQTRCH